jgi:hypothetical protein
MIETSEVIAFASIGVRSAVFLQILFWVSRESEAMVSCA